MDLRYVTLRCPTFAPVTLHGLRVRTYIYTLLVVRFPAPTFPLPGFCCTFQFAVPRFIPVATTFYGAVVDTVLRLLGCCFYRRLLLHPVYDVADDALPTHYTNVAVRLPHAHAFPYTPVGRFTDSTFAVPLRLPFYRVDCPFRDSAVA